MKTAWLGTSFQNEMAPILGEYNKLGRLRKLGFVFDGAELSQYKAECFSIIGTEIDRLTSEKMKGKKANGHQ